MQSILLARTREFIPHWLQGLSLPSLIGLLIAAQGIYFVLNRYLEYRVRTLLHIAGGLSYE
jgi:hypothetical protein